MQFSPTPHLSHLLPRRDPHQTKLYTNTAKHNSPQTAQDAPILSPPEACMNGGAEDELPLAAGPTALDVEETLTLPPNILLMMSPMFGPVTVLGVLDGLGGAIVLDVGITGLDVDDGVLRLGISAVVLRL